MSSELEDIHAKSQLLGEPATRGILFVVSSPSGGGKGTLIQRVLATVPDLQYSVSYTTRPPRNGEVDGREYFFVSPEKFESMLAANEFLEWAQVHGNLYGTSIAQVLNNIGAGHDMLLELDVQGAASVRELIMDSVSVFILPPSFEVLRRRLQARGTDSPEELSLRLRNAPEELSHYVHFDYVIINEDLETASCQLTSIIAAERVRRERQEEVINEVIKGFIVS
jgi:guanylate kinase